MSNASHNALLTSFSIANAAYAVALLVAPRQLIDLFGLTPDVSSIWLARLLGCLALGLGALAFFARHLDSLDARRAIDAGFLVSTSSMLIISLWAQYVGVMNALGWADVALAAAFSVGFFWFLAGEDRVNELMRPRPSG